MHIDVTQCTIVSHHSRRHPDKNPDNVEEATENFKRVYEAHQRMQRDTDGSQSEDEFDEEEYEAAMDEAMEFFIFMCVR